MITIECRWGEFKAICQAKNLSMQCEEAPGVYKIFAGDAYTVYRTELFPGEIPFLGDYAEQHSADLAEFEASYRAGCNVTIEPKTSDRRTIIAPSWESTEGLDPTWTGRLYTATAGAYSIFDEVITHEIRLRGGWYALVEPSQAAVGDYVEFSVVDKDDVLGLFGPLGVPEGGILELKKYVRKDYVTPSLVGTRQTFKVGGAFPVIAGLYLRTAYQSVGLIDVTFKAVIESYE